MILNFNLKLFIALWACTLAQPLFSQFNVEISFKHLNMAYTPLTQGDTILGGDNDPWGFNFAIEVIPLNPPVVISGFEDRLYDELWITSSGGIGLGHFCPENRREIFMDLAAGLPLDDYCSALVDPINSDQSFVILYQDEEFIRVEYQNVALLAEFLWGSGFLESRFNFQIEYRLSDSRVRYYYGPSTITAEGAEIIADEFLHTYFGFEESIYNEQGQWEDTGDLNFLVLVGLAESPSFFIPQSADSWPPIISLVNFPPEGTVYEFNLELGTSIVNVEQPGFKWEIYPNPVSETINFKLYNHINFGSYFNVHIYDLSGKLIYSNTVYDSKQLGVGFLNPGTYMIEVASDYFNEVKIFTKK
ncbi:MAG: T9SS C-terminal target domain-containing protein [Saprospirales bacterium]|nr:MAG: T9SS C-terminal target domain-containing protein [Saprospirales bacterium]